MGASLRTHSARGVTQDRRWRVVLRSHAGTGVRKGFVDLWWPDGSYMGRFRMSCEAGEPDLERIVMRLLRDLRAGHAR